MWQVDIAVHVVIPNGIAQMVQPILAGIARDRGVPPRYIQSLSSFLVALAPFSAPHITGPGLALLYGFNFGSVWYAAIGYMIMIAASLAAVQAFVQQPR